MTAYKLRELIEGDKLNKQEIDALFYAAKGWTALRTGEHMHLAEDTIKQYRKQACAKLAADNITHGVAIAIGTGLIDISRIVGVE